MPVKGTLGEGGVVIPGGETEVAMTGVDPDLGIAIPLGSAGIGTAGAVSESS